VKKRILIVSQYFWPENFKINDIAVGLKDKGYHIEVLTGKPNYPSGKLHSGYTFFNRSVEYWNDIKIYRTPLIPRGNGHGIQLFFNYISFAILGSIRVLFIKNKFDKIIVFEPSPITVGIPAIVSKYKFKAPIYFWVQDLWPASISAAGGVKNQFVLNLFNQLTKFIYSHCYKILVQSKAFFPYILNQNVDLNKLIYYPNSAETYYKCKTPDPYLLNNLPNGFKIMFAGNIGESQSFDTLLNAAKLLKQEEIHVYWLILGEGRLKNYVEEKIISYGLQENFKLLGAYPSEKMPDYFSCADVLLVSLIDDPVFALTIPSKIQSYLACGKPIITSLTGEGSRIIDDAKAGFTSKSEDTAGLINCIKKALKLNQDELSQLGKNARQYFEKEFEREKLINKLESIIS
jgi:glycosyltransferase involved in cell wall biosynthesis